MSRGTRKKQYFIGTAYSYKGGIVQIAYGFEKSVIVANVGALTVFMGWMGEMMEQYIE